MEVADGTIRRPRVGYVLVAIAAAALAFSFVRSESRSGDVAAIHERRPMPQIELRKLDGGVWRLADHRGQVAVINYWATWCAPCWEETPVLTRLSEEMGRSGLVVVGIATDEGSPERVDASVRRFVHAFGVNYPIGSSSSMSQIAYGMEALPTTILVDRNGRVANTYAGAIREEELKAGVRTLLAETTTL